MFRSSVNGLSCLRRAEEDVTSAQNRCARRKCRRVPAHRAFIDLAHVGVELRVRGRFRKHFCNDLTDQLRAMFQIPGLENGSDAEESAQLVPVLHRDDWHVLVREFVDPHGTAMAIIRLPDEEEEMEELEVPRSRLQFHDPDSDGQAGAASPAGSRSPAGSPVRRSPRQHKGSSVAN